LPRESQTVTGIQGNGEDAARKSHGLDPLQHPTTSINLPSENISNDINDPGADSTQQNNIYILPEERSSNMTTTPKSTGNILSLNCAKSIATTIFILQYAEKCPNSIILCLQEPGLEKSGDPPTHPSFTCFTPGPKPKCVTYVRTKSFIQSTMVMSSNSSFLGCRIKLNKQHPFTLYNIYSTGGRDAAFGKFIDSFEPSSSCIMIGDFNCRHSWWYGKIQSTKKNQSKTCEPSQNANKIVDWLEKNGFQLHNRPGIPTHYPRNSGNPTVLDLCFSKGMISHEIDGWMIDHDSTSDHSIVGLRIYLPVPKANISIKKPLVQVWSKADWNQFKEILASKNFDFSNIGSKIESERAVDSLYQAIREGVAKAVPMVQMKPKFAPWWTKNLEWLTVRLKRARKRAQKTHLESDRSILDSIKTSWEKAVKSSKRNYWKKKLETATSSNIWKTQKNHTRVHSKVLPDIDGASTFLDKCTKLRDSLFPSTDNELPPVPDDYVTHKIDLSNEFSPVNRAEIKRALNKSNKNGAVGNDCITYTMLGHLDEIAPSILPQLATAVFRFGFHHREWKHAICVVVPKKGKSSYSTAKSYRPISLLSCLGKLMEKIAAHRIEKAGKICGAISATQFGSISDHSAIDALFRTISQVSEHLGPQSTRGYRHTVRPSLAAHDILGAFNNTRPDALLRIMSLRKMPKYMIEWVKDFTANRSLSFSFDDCLEPAQRFLNSLPQGSPVSAVLFVIVMSAILDIDNKLMLESISGYIDDMTEVYADKNIGIVTPVLSNSFMLKAQRAEVVGLSFAPEKSEVIHFSTRSRTTSKYPEHLTITGNYARTVMPSKQITLLGIITDNTLSFIIHAQNAASKAIQTLGSIMYLRQGDYGINPKIARYLVLAKVMPRMFWASPIWWTGTQSVLAPLEIGYNRIARWITGLPTSTRTTKLLNCAQLPPLHLWLDLKTTNYAIRLITLPINHNLKPLPPYDPSRVSWPGAHRILSFVAPYLTDKLETRSYSNPIDINSITVHLSKPKNESEAKTVCQSHSNWIKSLQTDSLIIYTDGSRSTNGSVGAGWVFYRVTSDGLRKIFENNCHLGYRMEVFDAELHAVHEALLVVAQLGFIPGPIHVCIDNQAVTQVLSNNPDKIEGSYRVCTEAHSLTQMGWKIFTVWIPSHCGIPGNEAADKMAKIGTENHDETCIMAYTSVAWMRRAAKETFLKKWRSESNSDKISWKYPEERDGWSFRLARAIFRVYCGRTDIDPRHGQEPTICKCNDAEISSKHIIGHCSLFENARNRMRNNSVVPAIFTNEMILDPEWGPRMINFLRATRLGFGENLKWENSVGNSIDTLSEEEDFNVGAFE
jgi:ribonuclease HI